MKYLFIAFLCCLSCLQLSHASESDSIKICNLLEESKRYSQADDVVSYFAKKFVGIPYVANTLEVNDEEQLVVNLRQMDCTTYVETVVSLALCVQNGQFTYQDYINALRNLRYRNGVIDGYGSRLHYFSDWIDNNENMGFVKEVQSPNPPFSAIQVLNLDFMSKHPHSYKALRISPYLVEEIRETEINLNGKKMNYIPKSSLANTSLLRKVIRNGDILAIVTNVKGLDIAHLGIALWRKDGLHMLHASSKQGRVVEDNNTLRTYLNGNKSFLGIRVLRLTH
ncbi:MAG: DUF1460 domain-containing protein [Prevotella sp.]|nr:DUF1460 domain-containing protein [Prevotella sp.]